jgi:hypothetical protein
MRFEVLVNMNMIVTEMLDERQMTIKERQKSKNLFEY